MGCSANAVRAPRLCSRSLAHVWHAPIAADAWTSQRGQSAQCNASAPRKKWFERRGADRAKARARSRPRLSTAAPNSEYPLRPRPRDRCRSPRLRTRAATAAPSSRSASAYSAINASPIGARRCDTQRSRVSKPLGQPSSSLCAQLVTTRPRRPKPGAAVPLRPRSSAKPSLRGAIMARSMAWFSGAIFCRSCNVCPSA